MAEKKEMETAMEGLKQRHHELLQRRAVLAIQELLLHRRLVAASIALAKWHKKTLLEVETETKANALSAQKAELDGMMPGCDVRGAVLDMGGPRRGASHLKETSVKGFCQSLQEGQGALVLILDGITDPHNLGAVLRSADQFGVDLVIIPERRSVQANETVVKVSSGAAQYVTLAVVTNIVREIETLKEHGFWVYGADMNGDPSYDMDYAHRSAIVMGSEGDGISQLVRKRCDMMTSIPMRGHIDSLNVSVATGILLYEFRRKER